VVRPELRLPEPVQTFALLERKNLDARTPTLTRLSGKYLGVFVSERRRSDGSKRSAAEDKRVSWRVSTTTDSAISGTSPVLLAWTSSRPKA